MTLKINECMYITESLCCIPGTNTILKINYTPIKLTYIKYFPSQSFHKYTCCHFLHLRVDSNS